MKKYNVYNYSGSLIERCGKLFPGETEVEVFLTAKEYKIITKCPKLSVMEVQKKYTSKKK